MKNYMMFLAVAAFCALIAGSQAHAMEKGESAPADHAATTATAPADGAVPATEGAAAEGEEAATTEEEATTEAGEGEAAPAAAPAE